MTVQSRPILWTLGSDGLSFSSSVVSDYQGTLRRLSEMGYRLIETGRYSGESASTYLKFLDQLGLRVIASGGTSISALKKDPSKAAQSGAKHCIVEHDNPPDGMRCAEESIRYLKGLKL